jgi:DNA-binding beta-propeller fold protein YncE
MARRQSRSFVVAVVLAAVLGSPVAGAASSLPLREVARVPLPGAAVRFDYTSVDPSLGRLWIAHMDDDTLLAFDLRSRRVVRSIPAPGVHGVIAVPSLGRVYASATDQRRALTIESRSGRVLASAPAGEYPDGLAYAANVGHVFVSDESGGVETVLSASGRRLATIALGGEAGNVQYDAGSGKVLVDVQSRDDLAVIDPRSNRVVRRIHLTGCDSSHSLLIDSPRRIAFVTCEGNARLLTVDLRTMKTTGMFMTGSSPDVLAFDQGLRRLYVSSESGTVGVYAESGSSVKPLGLAFLASGAHTVAVDQRTHLVYFPLERGSRGGPELLIMKPRL